MSLIFFYEKVVIAPFLENLRIFASKYKELVRIIYDEIFLRGFIWWIN